MAKFDKYGEILPDDTGIEVSEKKKHELDSALTSEAYGPVPLPSRPQSAFQARRGVLVPYWVLVAIVVAFMVAVFGLGDALGGLLNMPGKTETPAGVVGVPTPSLALASLPESQSQPMLMDTPVLINTPTKTPVPLPCFDTRFQRLEDSGGAIQDVRGYLYDINGQPLKGAVVEIYVKSLWSRFNRNTLTTHDGGFVFENLGGSTNHEYIVRVIGMPYGAPAYHTWEEPYTFKFNTGHDRAVVFIYQVPFRADICHLPEEVQ